MTQKPIDATMAFQADRKFPVGPAICAELEIGERV
jgi:hypothetical protein